MHYVGFVLWNTTLLLENSIFVIIVYLLLQLFINIYLVCLFDIALHIAVITATYIY